MKKILITLGLVMSIAMTVTACEKLLNSGNNNLVDENNKDIIATSDSLEDSEDLKERSPKDRNPKLTSTITKGSLKKFKDELPEVYKEVINEGQEIEGGYTYITKEYNETRDYDEQVVFTKSDVIYPGAIFKGDALLNNEYVPLNLPRNPIGISLSMQGDANIKSEIEDPRVISSARESINELLNQENLEGPASLTFSVSEVESANQLTLELGSGIGIGGVSLGFGITPSSTFEKSKKFAQFTQRYYSIGADRPQNVSDFFNKSVTEKEFMEASNGYTPVYVSNVIYGRRGIFELETDYDSNSLETAFSIGYDIEGIGVNGEVKDAVTNSIKNSEMKLYILGGNADTAVQAIDSYDAFVEHIKSGGTYSSSNRGEIIGFELRYINDDSLAKTVINEKYKVTEKVPRNRTISYDVDYIQADSDENSPFVQMSSMEIFIDKDSEPLWQNTSKKIGNSIYVGNMRNIYGYQLTNHQRKSFDQIEKDKSIIHGGRTEAVYYISNPKQIEYSNPNEDKVVFTINLAGNFSYSDGGFSSYRKAFGINRIVELDIKDIETSGVIPITVEGDDVPSYNFEIGLKVTVEYPDGV